MFKFTNIPKKYDELMYMKILSKEYYIPYDILFCLRKECNNEKDFFDNLNWIRKENGYNWKIKES